MSKTFGRRSCFVLGVLLAAAPMWAVAACTPTKAGTQTFALAGGLSIDGGKTFLSSIDPGQSAEVYIDLRPLPEHIGKTGDISVIVSTGLSADLSGSSINHSREVYALTPQGQLQSMRMVAGGRLNAATDAVLQDHYRVKLYSGVINSEQGYRINATYCVDDTLYAPAQSVSFAVEHTAPQELVVAFPPLTRFSYTGNTLNFRGTVTSSEPYQHADVELAVAGKAPLNAAVAANGEWSFSDVAVTTNATLTLRVDGQVVDAKQYTIGREPVWRDLEGITLDSKNRLAYVLDRAGGRILTVDLDTGARGLLAGDTTLPGTTLMAAGDLALQADTGQIFTAASSPNSLVRVDADTGAALAISPLNPILPTNQDPFGLSGIRVAAFSKAHNEFFYADQLSGKIYAYNVQTGNIRLVGQFSEPLVVSADGRILAVSQFVFGMALDGTNSRLLLSGLQPGKLWAMDMGSGTLNEIFDQSKATFKSDLPPASFPEDPISQAIPRQFSSLAYDGKRNAILAGGSQSLYRIDPGSNTITQIFSGFIAQQSVAEVRDIEYDEVADRYVFVDGQANKLFSFDPVSRTATQLSGRSDNGIPMFIESHHVVADHGKHLLSASAGSLFSVVDFANGAYITKSTPRAAVVGIYSTAIGASNIVRDFVDPGTFGVAYDQSRDAHVIVRQLLPSGVIGVSGTERPPLNEPSLGIRGIPRGTVGGPTGIADIKTEITVVDINNSDSRGMARETKLTPTYAGDLQKDMQFTTLVAVSPDGTRYVFGKVSGELFVLDTATMVLSKLPSAPIATPIVAMTYAGDTLLQLDQAGEIFKVNMNSSSIEYGLRTIFVGTGLDIGVPGGMVPTRYSDLLVTSRSSRLLMGVNLISGVRGELSGLYRGQGDRFVAPTDVVLLEDPTVAYVTDVRNTVIVDLQSGDRIVMGE